MQSLTAPGTALATKPASPAPSAPSVQAPPPPARTKPRPGCALRSTAAVLSRRRCATARASKQPLARLRLAGGYRVGCSTTPSRCAPRLVYPVAGARLPCLFVIPRVSRTVRRLRRQLCSRLRRLRRGNCFAAPCAIAQSQLWGKSQAIQHNRLLYNLAPVAHTARLVKQGVALRVV